MVLKESCWHRCESSGMALSGGHSPVSAPCCCLGVPAQRRARCVHWELLRNFRVWDRCDQDTKRRSKKGLILIVDIFYNYCQKFSPLPFLQTLLIISSVTKTTGFNCPVPASPASISRAFRSDWLRKKRALRQQPSLCLRPCGWLETQPSVFIPYFIGWIRKVCNWWQQWKLWV